MLESRQCQAPEAIVRAGKGSDWQPGANVKNSSYPETRLDLLLLSLDSNPATKLCALLHARNSQLLLAAAFVAN
jgi:hypothetical protein